MANLIIKTAGVTYGRLEVTPAGVDLIHANGCFGGNFKDLVAAKRFLNRRFGGKENYTLAEAEPPPPPAGRLEKYRLSNGKELVFYAPPGKYCVYVNDTLFPGWHFDACLNHFYSVWQALGLTWERVLTSEVEAK